MLLYIHTYIYIYIYYKGRRIYMAGKLCPNCNKYTFFEINIGRECSKCGYKMILPVNNGKGGRGQKCSNCSKLTVFNNKCSNCGAQYK